MGKSTTTFMTSSKRRVPWLRRRGRELQYDRWARICHCGIVAPLHMSWIEQNPGRRFFGCRNYQQVNACRFFQWHDDEMGERSTEVINELLGYVDKLNDENSMQRRGVDEKVDRNVQAKILDIYLVMKKLDGRLKKVDSRLRLAISGLVLT